MKTAAILSGAALLALTACQEAGPTAPELDRSLPVAAHTLELPSGARTPGAGDVDGDGLVCYRQVRRSVVERRNGKSHSHGPHFVYTDDQDGSCPEGWILLDREG